MAGSDFRHMPLGHRSVTVARPFRICTGFHFHDCAQSPYGPPPANVNATRYPMSARLLLISHAATSATRRAAFPLDEGIEAVTAPKPWELPRADRAWCGPERRTRETASF